MKFDTHKIFSVLALLLIPSLISKAQISIDFSQFEATQNVRLKCQVLDAKSGDAIPYATVYLIPQGDTTITYFALSNDKGSVSIEEILPGKYEINAEMIGFKPYKKEYDLHGWEKNIGAIRLEENPEFIDAATITALGNPVTMKKDTIEFNASAFHVGENAMLEDLLKKMPGMEVASDGTVTVNGEQVDKITVGGKTFFFNDPSMAVKNLPAKIVDKIKVIDKKKDEAQFTGISTKDDKEKVMDIQLKKEYQKGWFGNAKLLGGASVVPKSEAERMGRPSLLFNSNALAAGYNEKDQLTILGNAKNVSDSEQTWIFFGDSGNGGADDLALKRGLESSAQAGANFNTDRIKGFDTNVSLNYNFNRKDAREQSARTSFRSSGPDMMTNGEYVGKGDNHKINTAAEFEKTDEDKYMISIRPSFSYTSQDRNIINNSETGDETQQKNSSSSITASHTNLFNAGTFYNFGVKDLGRKGRSITLWGEYRFSGSFGNSSEISRTEYSSYTDERNLLYDKKNSNHYLSGVLSYVEPISERWSVQGRITGCYTMSDVRKNARNGSDGSANDYYSGLSRNDDKLVRERVLFQWKKEKTKALFGVQLDQEENVTFSRSLGRESTVGSGQWNFNWSPYAEVEVDRDNLRLWFEYGGQSNTPSGTQTVPTLNINNPVQMMAGNIYLRPSFSHYCYLGLRHNNPAKYSFLNVHLSGNAYTNQIVYASWFDTDGNRYAVPVNTPKPGISARMGATAQTPLDSKKHFTFSVYANVSCSINTSYQSTTQLPGLDKDNFNYDNMMAWFWGSPEGDLFYSGASGFSQSRTNGISYGLNPSLEYKIEKFSAEISAGATNRITKYSLNPAADINTWDFSLNANVLYSTPKEWEFETFATYNFYRGYSSGYGEPEFIWNAGVSKKIKAFTISLRVKDIMNQSKSLSRTATDEYVEDVYRNVMGRYFLLGVSFNFGKMNARNNQKAQNAMWNMIF